MNTETPHATDAQETPEQGRTRRMLLAGFSATALGGVIAAVSAQPASAAPPTVMTSRDAATAKSVGDLQKLGGKEGDVVAVAGYATPGDGGGGLFYLVTKNQPAVNAGTVVPGKKKTVWVRLHNGVGDFRWFGVFGPGTAADDALATMVADPMIHRIEAHSDLNFVKRHIFSRSNIEFDFGNHLMTTDGIVNAAENDPFAAVMFFKGEATDLVHTATLAEDVPDLSDVFGVADSSFFQVGKWYAAEVNALSGRWEREFQRLIQVTEIIDSTHIRINYQSGWLLKAGRSITWREVNPVHDVRVSNLRFLGKGTDQFTGSHPLAFEYAVRCDVDRIDGTGTFWPLIQRRWNTHYTTERCNLTNPTSVTWGGAGYLTQQIYCMYGYVANCHTSNARHLNDWTGSSHGLVENCHGDGDDQGPFVTHGQYEHDLTYIGNSGLMTFANSGAAWGSAAKRITVRQHVCSWFVARVKVTDLTLEDVQVIGKKSLDGSGMMWINADGAQLRGCSATNTLIITQASSLSDRSNVIEASEFTFVADGELTNASVTKPIVLQDTKLVGLHGVTIGGAGSITMRGGELHGGDRDGSFRTGSDRLHLDGVDVKDARIVATKDGGVVQITGGSRVETSKGAAISRDGAGARTVQLANSTFTGAGTHVQLSEGTNNYSAVGCRFETGTIDLSASGFGSSSTLLHTSNVEVGLTRNVPDESDAIVVAANAVA